MSDSGPGRHLAVANRVRRTARVARTLGPTWAARRSLIEVKRRSGHLRRRTPVMDWHEVEHGARLRADLFPTTAPVRTHDLLARDLEGRDLEERGRDLVAGRFVAFDTQSELTAWHTDPLTGAVYPADRHWTDVRERPDADLKMVWEASRFGWAFDLARLAAAEPDGGWGRRFWDLFADWRTANRPNAGVNWSCGQESSIRLMAVTFAASVCLADAGDDDLIGLARVVEQTTDRVLSFIEYADSQNNNHLATEAVGLLTAALLHPGASRAEEAERVGRHHLERVCRELIFADGGSSQYSMNYHRVYVESMAWARWAFVSAGRTAPPWLDAALGRALDLLVAVTDPADGSAPFYGADDGARILPVTDCRHRDLRPTIRLASIVLGRDDDLGPGPWDEIGHWFAPPVGPDLVDDTPGDVAPTARVVAAQAGRSAIHFPDAGVTVLRRGRDRMTLRCGPHRFRPSHADQLHADVWLDGHQVAYDPGTWSYKDDLDGVDLAETAAHNTLFLPERGQMTRLSRFLWADWSNGVVEDCAHDPKVVWAGTHFAYLDLGVDHYRRVEEIDGGWWISDRLDAARPRRFTVGWLLDGEPEPSGGDPIEEGRLAFRLPDGFRYEVRWRTDTAADLEVEVIDSPDSALTWFCSSYRRRRPMTRLLLSATTAGGGITTELIAADAAGPDAGAHD